MNKKTTWRTSYFIVLGLFIFIFSVLVGIVYKNYNIEKPESNKDFSFEQNPLAFIEIAKNNAEEIEYNKDFYNCVDYSLELKRRLLDKGFNAKLAYGTLNKNKNNKHIWVILEVPIEATTGKILSPMEYNYNYELEKIVSDSDIIKFKEGKVSIR